MRLISLSLRDFRNYTHQEITFSPGLNYIWGDNAQGKTNLLEAIYVLLTGRSFRTRCLEQLVRFGASQFEVAAQFERDGVVQTLSLVCDGTKKRVVHNATVLPKLSALLGLMYGVVLTPEDGSLIKGGPAARRTFLDVQLSQTHPLYLQQLVRYQRALKCRNTLLGNPPSAEIEVWEEELAHSAAFLTCARIEALHQLEQASRHLQHTLSMQQETLELVYASKAQMFGAKQEELHAYFLHQYQNNRLREYGVGYTIVGPHRDDIHILLNQQLVRLFGSEGQQRTCAAALRFAQWSRLKAHFCTPPLMCVDDIGISLDKAREEKLIALLQEGGQVFLTSPQAARPELKELSHVGVEQRQGQGHFLQVHAGVVRQN